MGGATGECGGTTYPHFCGLYPTGGYNAIPRPIFMKLEIHNYLPNTTPHAKNSGGYVANRQFDA